MDQAVDFRKALRSYGLMRVGIGLAFLVAPRWFLGKWIGPTADTPAGLFLGRMFGARDAVLGAGAVAASRTGTGMRTWALVGAAADASDAVLSLSAMGRLPRRGLASAAFSASFGVASGLWVARGLRSS